MNYQRIYDSLIAKAKERKLNEYFEIHHVIPKCLNGDDSKDNLVKLTAKEHFIAHYILWKIHRNSKLFYAFNNMRMKSDNQKRYRINSTTYEILKKEFIKNHPMKNEETKQKMIKSLNEFNQLKKLRCDFKKCKHCKSMVYSLNNFCSKECEEKFVPKNNKIKTFCEICGKHKGRKKYTCSKECFQIFLKNPENEYGKTLSEKRSKYINENFDKIKEINQKICDNTNQELKGIKIKNTKKINNSGNNHKNEKVILIYNKSNEIVFIKEKFINFNVFCENNDLDYNKLCKTYRRNNINKNYNYYARIKVEDGI